MQAAPNQKDKIFDLKKRGYFGVAPKKLGEGKLSQQQKKY